jgi:hypothetical protein
LKEVGRSDVRCWFDRTLWIGPVAFFMAACAWSVLDAQYASDTWIGLAAGRHIMEQLDWGRFYETFPRRDTFSYTFYEQVWFNQNWLANLGQYWIYERLGPSAVVYGTWMIVACIHVFVLLAVYWRTESWLAAWLATPLVGIGGRDFLEPRAATVGLLCTAALWALICAIEGQRDRRRWWPIALLLPLLLFWSNAHGGFVFGYGLLALYCGHWVAVRLCRMRGAGIAASEGQILSIAVVLIAAIMIAVMIGPYGIESFVHPGKLASSRIFRTVSEWHPAYSEIGDVFPPMWRFWGILGLTGSSVLLLCLAKRIATRPDVRGAPDRAAAPWSLFDVAIVLICMCMTLGARRFAPLLYVVSAPVLAVWVMHLVAPLVPHLRGRGIPVLKLAAALAAVVTGWLTWTTAHRELLEAFKDEPVTGLLERTRGNRTTHEAIRFVAMNQLRVNLFADYGEGGSIMFYAPLARVFIDPRADQLYTEQHFRRYLALMNRRTDPEQLRWNLDGTDTNAVLVQRVAARRTLWSTLLLSPDWVLVLLNSDYYLFLRRDSPALERLGELIRESKEWRPAKAGTITPDAQASRAIVLLNTSPPDLAQALDLLKGAVDRQRLLGISFYPTIIRLLIETAGLAAAREYISLQVTRVTSDAAVNPGTRSALLASLAEFRRHIELPNDPPTPRTGTR